MSLYLRAMARDVYRKTGGILDVDDLTQEGELAVVEAEREGRVPSDPQHAIHYKLRRARGAMIDASRAVYGRHADGYVRPVSMDADDYTPTEDAAQPPPEHLMQIAQAVERLYNVGDARQRQFFGMLHRGHTEGGAAKILGIHASRASQYKSAARLRLKGVWG